MLKLIDLYADWCQPCKALKPVLDEIEKEYSSDILQIERIDVDESQEHAQFFEVRSIPTLIFIKDGTEVDKLVGFVPKNILVEKINSLL